MVSYTLLNNNNPNNTYTSQQVFILGYIFFNDYLSSILVIAIKPWMWHLSKIVNQKPGCKY